MHEYLDCDPSDSPKMIKWAKYFISVLFQMIACYINTQEIQVVIETARMMEWITIAFFDPRSSYYLSIFDYTKTIYNKFEYNLNEKNELIFSLNKIVEKHFKKDYLHGFIKYETEIETNIGFIPNPSNEETAFLKKLEKEYDCWKKPEEWDIRPIEMIRNHHDEKVTSKAEKELENQLMITKSKTSQQIILSDQGEEKSEFLMHSYRKRHTKNNFSVSTKNSSLFTLKNM